MAVFAQREAQHIGHGVDMAVLFVVLADLLVVHQGDVHLGGALKVLHFQHGMAAAAHEKPHSGRNFDGFLCVFNDDPDLFHGFCTVSFLHIFHTR